MEFIAIVAIQGVENILMVCPAIYLLSNVTERHFFLTTTVGPVFLEVEAMNSLMSFVNLSLTTVLVSIPLQIALFWMYNLFGHPWKRFLYEIYIKEEKQFPGMVRQEGLYILSDGKAIEDEHITNDESQFELIVKDNLGPSQDAQKEEEKCKSHNEDIEAIAKARDNQEEELEMDDLAMDKTGVDDIDKVLEMLRKILEF